MQAKILVAEDDTALLSMIVYNLERQDFAVQKATDGENARMILHEDRPDLAILDWMMPYVSGLQLCRHIRRSPDLRDLPVIILTARGESEDRVRGLEAGADDYISKPFSPSELVARVRALLRRSNLSFSEAHLEWGDVTMDPVRHHVTCGKRRVHLGPTEFRLLRHFLQNPGRVYSRRQILDAVWGQDIYVEERTVDAHILRLRQALSETDGKKRNIIRTVRSVGYALDDQERNDTG